MADSREHERYSIPHAEDLFSDTWAEEVVCPNCGRALEAGAALSRVLAVDRRVWRLVRGLPIAHVRRRGPPGRQADAPLTRD